MSPALSAAQIRGVMTLLGTCCAWLLSVGRPRASVKGDGSYLALDPEMQRRLVAGLRALFPGFHIAAEESVIGPAPADSPGQISLDPIDGTSLYLSGFRAWAVLLAVATRGDDGVLRPQLAVIVQPGLPRTLAWDQRSGRATVDGRALPSLEPPTSWKSAYLWGSSDLADWHLGPRHDRPKVRAHGATGAHLAQLLVPIEGLATRSDPAVVLTTSYKPHDILAGATLAVRGAGMILHHVTERRDVSLVELWNTCADDPSWSPPLLIGPEPVVRRLADVVALRDPR